MRLFASILLIYFSVLIAMPCHDEPGSDSLQKTEVSQNSNHQHIDGDLCSPFCTCSCCLSLVVLHDPIIQFQVFPFSQKNNQTHLNIAVSTAFFSIWQPPQLA